ncbi:MAG: tetratricopeptide repeat protein [Ferruginibacter sp.]
MKNLKFTLILLISILAVNFSQAQSIDDGKKFLYYEKFISAKNVFQQLLTANSNNDEAAYWLGQTLIAPDEDKDIEGAKAVYQKGLAANPNSALLNAGMGHIELLEGKTQQARNHFETALSLNKSIDVLDAVGFANGDFDSKFGDAAYAVEKLTQATNSKKFKDARIMTDLGDAYRKLGDGGSAQRSYEAALAIDPSYARAKFRIGRIYQSQGRNQEPIYLKYYNDAIALDPNYSRVYFYLHQYFYETDVVKSAAYLDKYLKAKGSDEANACFLNAQMKFAQGLFAETITAADACLNAGGTPYPNLYGLKAYAYNKMGDSANAKLAFDMYFQKQKPGKLGPRDYFTYAGVLLKFAGNEALAGTFMQKAVELDSTEIGKITMIKEVATVFEARQMFGDAADWYKKIIYIKKDPGKTDIYNAGIGYYRAKNYPAVIEMFDLYIQKFPDGIFGYYYKGAAQAGIDTLMVTDSAYQTYLKAVAVGEVYPENDKTRILPLLKGSYRYLIIYAANKLKDKDLALTYVDKALLLVPADAELMGFKESISKMGAPKPPATKPPATKPATKPAGGKTPLPKKK